MKIHVAFVLTALTGFVTSAFSEEQNPPVQVAPTAPNPVSEVARMAEAGVSEKTILAYVETSPSVVVTGNDVVLLHQRGVSDKVITAMLQRSPQPAEPEVAPVAASSGPAVETVAMTTGPNPPIVYTTGPNAPIIYPTPVREITPLMRPYTVYAAPYDYYGASSVIILGSSYGSPAPCYGGGFRSYGGYQSYGGYPAYAGGYRSYGWGSTGGSGWGCRGNGWSAGRYR